MKFSEEQVKDIVALKDSLIEQIDRHQESMEMLEKNVTVLDLFLKKLEKNQFSLYMHMGIMLKN